MIDRDKHPNLLNPFKSYEKNAENKHPWAQYKTFTVVSLW